MAENLHFTPAQWLEQDTRVRNAMLKYIRLREDAKRTAAPHSEQDEPDDFPAVDLDTL